ncbi:zinc-ribbon domain-containing protein [Agrilactobacillus composti]|nr:zinc ribbon domain-containing protein [Agrilactobacillus composti]
MDFCPNCGVSIAADQNFCKNCGYPLTAKARQMVMGVAQRMRFIAPDAPNTAISATTQAPDKVPQTRTKQQPAAALAATTKENDDPIKRAYDPYRPAHLETPIDKSNLATTPKSTYDPYGITTDPAPTKGSGNTRAASPEVPSTRTSSEGATGRRQAMASRRQAKATPSQVQAPKEAAVRYQTKPQGYGSAQPAALSREPGFEHSHVRGHQRGKSSTAVGQSRLLDGLNGIFAIILGLTSFFGGFISNGHFLEPGATTLSLSKTMALGGSNFRSTMILLLSLLLIGPIVLLIFSVWQTHFAASFKLAASVFSVLAYIVVFGLLIAQGIVSAGAISNFQFGWAAIAAIVALVVNFIVSVLDFINH